MAAEDNLSKQLFHGTTHAFKPGDIIEPRTPSLEVNRTIGITTTKTNYHAYATPDITEAKKYAKKSSKEKGLLFSPVYEVEPLKNDESLKSEQKNSWYNEEGEHPLNYHLNSPKVEHLKSTKGFRIKKQVGWS